MQPLLDLPTLHFIILGAAYGAGCYKLRAPPPGGESLYISRSGVLPKL
jgi:hypothetical protein